MPLTFCRSKERDLIGKGKRNRKEVLLKAQRNPGVPNLLEVQKESFREFLQAETEPEKRKNVGLQAIFNETFPITDVHENYSLEFVKYIQGTPRYSIKECQERNMTYAAPLKATLRLVIREPEGKDKRVKDIIEQDVFLGELPVLTETGTFVINGAERVVVSQLHRSPGSFLTRRLTRTAKDFFLPGSFRTAAPGSSSISMPTI